MSNINVLREERAALVAKQQELLNGDFSAEVQAQFDAIDAEIDSKEKHISAIEKNAKREAVQKSMADNIDNSLHSHKDVDSLEAFAKYLSNGATALNAADWDAIKNAQSVGTSSAGGITVPTTTMNYVTEALKAFGGIRAAAQVINTASGETMVFPTHDATSELGEIVAENATTNTLDTAFGSVNSVVYQYSSKSMAVSRQLLTDSAVNIVSVVMSTLASRIARIQNQHFTTGTGTGQPQGVVAASSTGVTVANAAAINVSTLLDLFHSLDVAYRSMGAWIMNDQTVKLLRKLLDSTGRPIFIGDDMGSSETWSAGSMFGRPVIVSNDMPLTGAGNKPILFGDFSKFIIRDVSSFGVEVYTDSAFGLKNSVGYNAWQRSGSVNTGINNIQALVTTA